MISTCMVQTNAIYQHAAGFDSSSQLSRSAKAACAASPLKLPLHYKTCSPPRPPLFCSWKGANQGYCYSLCSVISQHVFVNFSSPGKNEYRGIYSVYFFYGVGYLISPDGQPTFKHFYVCTLYQCCGTVITIFYCSGSDF